MQAALKTVGGTSPTYPNLTGATGAFIDISNGVLTGDVTLKISGDIAEPNVNALTKMESQAGSVYKVKIVPDGNTVRTLSTTVAGQSLIRLQNINGFEIDGSYNGTGNYFKIRRFWL